MKQMNEPITWDHLWMDIAKTVARRSKDPDTQVGCVLVSPDQRRMFIGYNGFPRKIVDTMERWQRPDKYRRVVHAEKNAILNRNCDVEGWTCYVTLSPCFDCAMEVIQAGISKVVYLELNTRPGSEDVPDSFTEANVEFVEYTER